MSGFSLSTLEKRSPTIVFEIFISGDMTECKSILQARAASGACYSVEKTEFIYTGGRESGCVVRLINYPRFPKTHEELEDEAIQLAHYLLERLIQGSCSVVGPKETIWITRRKEDAREIMSEENPA